MRKTPLKLKEPLCGNFGKACLLLRQVYDFLAHQVLWIETKLVNATLSPEDLRNANEIYKEVLIKKRSDVLQVPKYFKMLSENRQLYH